MGASTWEEPAWDDSLSIAQAGSVDVTRLLRSTSGDHSDADDGLPMTVSMRSPRKLKGSIVRGGTIVKHSKRELGVLERVKVTVDE